MSGARAAIRARLEEPKIGGRLVRGLTIVRPWPWGIVVADKRIENRSWWAPHWMIGQWIAIHAGQKFEREARDAMRAGLCGLAARRCPPQAEHVHSAIVGVAILARCTDVDPVLDDPWATGPVCWQLEGVRALKQPIPHRGGQRLWRLEAQAFELLECELKRAA